LNNKSFIDGKLDNLSAEPDSGLPMSKDRNLDNLKAEIRNSIFSRQK
jgi:hypothetical protein